MNIEAIKLNPIELLWHLHIVWQSYHLLHVNVEVIHHLSEKFISSGLSNLCDLILNLELLELVSHLSLFVLLVVTHDCLF
jgi:hypothetical protein